VIRAVLVSGALLAAAALAAQASESSLQPAWTTPVQLSSGDIALAPDLALGAAGDALVVWDHEVGEACPFEPANPACVHVVEAVSRAAGSTDWTAPIAVARPGIDSRPVAAVGGGDALVLWVHDIGENRVLQASFRRGPAGVWPEPTDLSEVTRRIGAHAAGIDAAGNVTVVWAGIDAAGRAALYAKQRDAAAGVWGAPIALSRAGGDVQGEAGLAVDPAGNAVAVWTVAGGVVQAATREGASGTWSTPVDLSAGGAQPDPAVAIDGAGSVTAVWSRGAVETATRPAGGSWAPATAISATLPGGREPDVAVDAAGGAVAIWRGERGIQSAVRPHAAATWSSPGHVGGDSVAAPRLAVDAVGNAVATWVDTHGAVRTAVRPAASGHWLSETGVSAIGGASTPQVEVGARGNAIVVWNRVTSPHAVVESAEFPGDAPLLTNLRIRASGSARVALPFDAAFAPWASPLVGAPLWNFGDGATRAGAHVSHVYGAAGRYTVSVTQGDVAGGSAVHTARILVVPATLRNVVPPSVLGSARVGATLRCANGRWTGTAPIRFAFRWLRGGRIIPGAGSERYRVRLRDAGALLSCVVTATNPAGSRAVNATARRIGSA
jgi:hypothetical protein